jgi:SM-20-related protein
VGTKSLLDIERLKQASLVADPFPHLHIEGLVPSSCEQDVLSDFPAVQKPGSFPLAQLDVGSRFQDLITELTTPPFADVLGEKLGMDLSAHPVMVTVRGMSRARDGQIHTDNTNKLITMLLYLGGTGDVSEGQLRLLRSADDVDDFAVEIPPRFGSLLVFKNGPTAWHGFKSFSGVRRVVQINWVATDDYLHRERARHGLSAVVKNMLPGRAKRAPAGNM